MWNFDGSLTATWYVPALQRGHVGAGGVLERDLEGLGVPLRADEPGSVLPEPDPADGDALGRRGRGGVGAEVVVGVAVGVVLPPQAVTRERRATGMASLISLISGL